MFEIGNTLREARLRRGLDILECEAETKIRAKYLRAMEEEQFDLMPSPTYVRGFLRTYAEFLDLDGQLVLDEYESRFDAFDAPDPHDSRRPAGGGGHDPRPRHRPARAG
ncbi:MAG: helix-turn-helix domain-containing protein, partial [Thermoleophilia bacterium]|nr:helix-turn-helix domain-containing protein [Thermoleophilia bacterium]